MGKVTKWLNVGTVAGRRILLLFLIADAVFLLFHVRSVATGRYPGWLLQADHGRPELFAYLMLGWTVIVLMLLARRWRASLLLGWAALVAFILLDDFLRLHERVGWWAWHRLSPDCQQRIHEQSLEIIVLAGFAAVLGIFIFAAHRRAEGQTRLLSTKLLIWVIAIGFFAFGVDLFSTRTSGLAYHVFTVLEDGGELVAISFLAATVIGTWLAEPAEQR